ncbi:hypothetical protein ACFIJ5_07725 [Haloimpatiens sp. FM7330]|uniref:hypothetical protein n=1 Tax=Haloimpatiens sp. FM7330 TaxID=3298610 RepID=UPI0036301C6A
MLILSDTNKVNKPSLKLLKDKRCAQLYKIYKDLIDIKKEDNKNKDKFRTSFPNKQTSKLFEYYTFVLIIKILNSNGYDWTRGWLADEDDCKLKDGDLPSETVLKFEKEDCYCELVYDMEIARDFKNKSQFISMSLRHNRPDIRLALFSKEDNKLKGSVIIEVKCRKKPYITNKKGEVMEQLSDYYNLCYSYYDGEKNLAPERGVIKNIIVTCPKQDDSYVKKTFGYNNFTLIQLEAKDNGVIYGYNELEEEIVEFLNKTHI